MSLELITASVLAPRSPAAAAESEPLTQRLQTLLDQALAELQRGAVMPAFRHLGPPLSALWTEAKAQGQGDQALALAHAHPLRELVMQDPYTWRARTKPRGYAGDAVMMDFIYNGVPPEGTTALGQALLGATTRTPMGLSVRFRRHLLQSLIDDTVVARHGARLMSVAAGHCRELQGSLVQAPWFDGEFLAIDQDELSCAEVARCNAGHRVQVVTQGVVELAARAGRPDGAAELGSFDLIYSAGLYDYLPDALARRLTQRLARLLAPGGRLVIGNFVPTGSGRGYMELFMDWPLVLRNEAQVCELIEGALPEAEREEVLSFLDPQGNVAYGVLRRAAASAGGL